MGWVTLPDLTSRRFVTLRHTKGGLHLPNKVFSWEMVPVWSSTSYNTPSSSSDLTLTTESLVNNFGVRSSNGSNHPSSLMSRIRSTLRQDAMRRGPIKFRHT